MVKKGTDEKLTLQHLKSKYFSKYLMSGSQFDFICDNNHSSKTMKLVALVLALLVLAGVFVYVTVNRYKRLKQLS